MDDLVNSRGRLRRNNRQQARFPTNIAEDVRRPKVVPQRVANGDRRMQVSPFSLRVEIPTVGPGTGRRPVPQAT